MGSFLDNLHPLLRRKKKNEYSDVNYAILQSINSMLDDAEQETIHSKVHSSLMTAENEFLETWGLWFGVYRKENESDVVYRKRIIEYVNLPRGTNSSIKLAIRNYLGDPTVGIEISEPWRDIFYLNQSKLNSEDRLMGNYYRFAVINVAIGVPFDDDIIAYIERFKPAGVTLHVTYDPSLPRANGEHDESLIIKLLRMKPYRSESMLTRMTGLDRELGGRIQLSDSDETVEPFVTNETEMNASNVLTGSFTQLREHYHLASLSRDFNPSMETSMGEVLGSSDELAESFYDSSLTLDKQSETVTLDSATQLYLTFNIDNYMSRKYFGSVNIPRTRESYSRVLGKPEVTLVMSSSSQGKTARVQAYNFRTSKWDTLHTSLLSNEMTKENLGLGDATDYLNDNSILFTRLIASNKIDLKVDFISLDYRTSYSEALDIKKPTLLTYEVIYEQADEAFTVDEYVGLVEEGSIIPDKEYILSDSPNPYVRRTTIYNEEAYIVPADSENI